MKDDILRRLGTVTKVHGGTYEVVDDETGMKILCTLNGKMKMHSIRLIIGDKVDIEVSAYDLTKGRVVYRHR
jgi:translation initiation factor IF-1